MAKSYFYDEGISDWRELVKGEQGEQGPVGPRGPQGPAIDIETGLPISVDTSVGTRVFVGDTMIHGDTGWRDISSRLLSGWTLGEDSEVYLRRVNDLVYIQVSRIYGGSSTSNLCLVLSRGFRTASGQSQIVIPGRKFNGEAGSAQITWNGYIALPREDDISASGVFMTDNEWPTALPGEPV